MLSKITSAILIIGGLNWLVYGVLQTDIGAILGGMDGLLARIIYIIVGLAAIYELVMMFTKKGGASKPMGGQM